MSEPDQIDYKSAGVDIEAGNEAVRRMKSHVAKTHTPAVLTGLGSFGTLYSLADALRGMKDPVMVQSTDGVGTKSKVTVMAGRYEDLGRDLVAAVAGDIAVMGAKPLTFLDYLGFHKVEPAIVEALVRGMSAACVEANIALVGGETAEMPAVYAEGDLDVVGFVTGVVDRAKLITGANINAGDVLYGVSSSGLHTNGWSLARKLLFEVAGYGIDATPPELGGASLADVLLAPHANYVIPIRRALDAGIPIKGMAHITGGGLVENVPRILPEGLGATVDRSTWKPQPIFPLMQRSAASTTSRCTAPLIWASAWSSSRRRASTHNSQRPCRHSASGNSVASKPVATKSTLQEWHPRDRPPDTARAIPHCLTQTNLPLPHKYPGKVRDTYDLGDGRLLLLTTDRQSGFDRNLGAIPFKGQVLNRTSLFWFEQTKHIVANHVLSEPACECAAGAQVRCAAD
jgi:phosphoribosylformylglycinamidine cyclo-ligase